MPTRLTRLFLATIVATAAMAVLAAPSFAAVADCGISSPTTLQAGDDNSSPAVNIGFPLQFYGTTYNQLYVNNNGNVTFSGPLADYNPGPLNTAPGSIPMIAPFWADVDTRNGAGTVTYGQGTYQGKQAFCVTWDSVGHYNVVTNVRDTFQLILVNENGNDFNAVYNYGNLQWDTGDPTNQFPVTQSAHAGYTNGSTNSLEFPGSGVSGAFLSGPNSLQNASITEQLGNDRAPGAPTGLQATAHTTSVDLSWTAPSDPGFPAQDTYTVTTTPDGGSPTSVDVTGTSTTVANLTPGTLYHFSVVAVNTTGSSSPATADATTLSAPSAPQNFTATGGPTSVGLTWGAPANPGVPGVSGYTITYNGPGSPITAGAGATSANVTGLAAGTSYTFTIVANSSAGDSPAAQAGATTTQSVPNAPTNVVATAGTASAVVTWNPATVPPGGSAVTGYSVSCTGSGPAGTASVGAGVTSATVTGLANGVVYSCAVTAQSQAGPGPAGVSNTFTPTANNAVAVIPANTAATLVTNNGASPTTTDATTSKLVLPTGPGGFANVVDTNSTGLPACTNGTPCVGQVTTYTLPAGYGTGKVGAVRVLLVYDKSVLKRGQLIYRVDKVTTAGNAPNGAVVSTKTLPFCLLGLFRGNDCEIDSLILPIKSVQQGVTIPAGDLAIQLWLTSGDPLLRTH